MFPMSDNHFGHVPPIHVLALLALTATACQGGGSRQADLPRKPDRWVKAVATDSDSDVQYIGKTKHLLITSITGTKPVDGRNTIKIGNEIEGIRIGAIRCSYQWRNATYNGEQYMWRGRWGCMAGRDSVEVANAVADNGDKRFPYIYIAPVTLGSD